MAQTRRLVSINLRQQSIKPSSKGYNAWQENLKEAGVTLSLRRAHLAIPIAGLQKFEADMDYTMLEKGHSTEIVTAAGSNLGKVFDSALRDLATV
ncbi:hypothetical protein Zm00014a_033525 [Zea mays]|uniref:Uncharacterized protein n=1 Tax=Zea mays TaxID=4577 RepID=A0A317YAD2_MAIZE|nr:hypothetical protein Zm00014a_033525 [Zea mays]